MAAPAHLAVVESVHLFQMDAAVFHNCLLYTSQYMRVEGLGQEVGFEDLIRAADEAECAGVQASIVNVNDDRFLSPDSMIEEILEACEETGQALSLIHISYQGRSTYFASSAFW